jgi:hypothetical protein
MVNLTTLAPDIVAAILDERLPPAVTLFELATGTPLLWEEQRGRGGGDRCVVREPPVDFWETGVYSFFTP